MNDKERIVKLEKALKQLFNQARLKSSLTDMYVINVVNKALEPDIDWSKVPFGAIVKNTKLGASGVFIEHQKIYDATCMVVARIYKGASIFSTWSIDHCTYEQPKKTKLIKHAWPQDGKMPEWINNNDIVLPMEPFGNAKLGKGIIWNSLSYKYFVIFEIDYEN